MGKPRFRFHSLREYLFAALRIVSNKALKQGLIVKGRNTLIPALFDLPNTNRRFFLWPKAHGI